MHVAAVEYDLHLPVAQSLKEKRAIVRPIIDGIRHRFGVSVAEVDHQDRWQRAAIGVAVVGSAEHLVVHVLDDVDRFVWSHPEVEVLSATRTWHEEANG